MLTRAMLIAIVALFASTCRADEPPKTPAPQDLPVRIIDCHTEIFAEASQRPPMLLVGSMDVPISDAAVPFLSSNTVDPCPCSKHPTHSRIDDYVRGEFKPRQPREGRDIVAFVRGPIVNSGEYFDIDSIQLDRSTITLATFLWTDDRPRHKNIPSTRTYAVRLGPLAAGEYKLHLVRRKFFMHSETSTRYADEGADQQWLPFTVLGSDVPEPWDAPLSKAILREDQLAPAPAANAGSNSLFQRTACLHRSHKTPFGGLSPNEVTLGVPELEAWQAAPENQIAYCVLKAPTKDQPLSLRLVHPMIGPRDWVTFAPLEWRGDRLFVSADIWHRLGGRIDTDQRTSEFVIALDIGTGVGMGAGEAAARLASTLQVHVEWKHHDIAD